MNKKNKSKRYLSKLLICTIIATNVMTIPYIYSPIKSYAEGEDIRLGLVSSQPVDVVLTLGDTAVDASNFKNELMNNLISKGVKPEKINISAVETNQANLQSAFDWKQDVFSYIGSISFQNNGSRIQMYGNSSNAGFNKIYTIPDNQADIKEQELGFSYTIDFGDSFDGAGILLNSSVDSNGLMNGYAVFIGKNGSINLYQLNNWTKTSGEDMQSNSGMARYLSSVSMARSGNYTLKTTKDKLIVINRDNGQAIQTLSLPNHYGWGFGFFSDHYSHGCNDIGKFALENLSLKTTRAKQFTEVIRTPSWTNNSARFLVDLDDRVLPEFDNPISSGEILSRLANSEINFVGLGTSTNQSQLQGVVNRNNSNGTFILNNPYAKSIDDLGTYIVSKLNPSRNNQYVLVGEPVSLTVSPSNLATNTANAQYPQGRWKINHNYKFFDNNLGQASWANQWQNNLTMTFDKPGKYDVSFEKDKHPTPNTLYVHRRPVASYRLGIRNNGSNYGVTTQDMSYDPDLQYKNGDRGIKEYEWKWRETTSSTWNYGQVPSTLPLGKNYIVQLRVKDYQETWSSPVTKYITTENVLTQPVAEFDVSPNPISMYTNLNINDSSYDPAGRNITAQTWTLYNSGKAVVSSSSTPPVNFRNYGAGSYFIGLKVQNDGGKWSEEYIIPLTVTNDTKAPEAIVTPTNIDWEINNETVNIEYSDEGGSGFSVQRYAITQSPNAPGDNDAVWSAWSSNTSQNVIVTAEGRNFIHLQAKDGANNQMKRSLGEYQIDRTKPVVTANRATTNWVKGGVAINVNATDSGSGVNRIQLPDGNFVNGSSTSFVASSNGDYIFKAEDNLGQIGTTTVNVNNVDNTAPELKLNQNPSRWVNTPVTITANATDSQSGVKRIQTPDGVWVNGATANFSVQGNGTYTFIAEDNVGNQTSKTYTIENIDKTPPKPPTIDMNDVDSNKWITAPSTPIKVHDNGDEGGSKVSKIEYRIIDLDSNTQKQDWTDYIPGVSEVNIDGRLRIDFRVVDDANNPSEIVSKTIMRDTHGPEIKITSDTKGLTDKTVTLNIEAIDNLAGFKRLQLPDGNWITNPKTSFVVSNNGEYTFVAEDSLGNKSTVKYSVRNIKKNPLITNNPNVLLKLKSIDYLSGTTAMKFRNENLAWTNYEAYNETKNWRLADGDGLKHVWVQYRDNATNESEPIEDIIILDTTDSVIDTFVLNNGKYYTNTTSIPVKIHATDNLTGVKNLLVSNDNTNWTTIPYSENFDWTLPSGDGEKTVYVKVEDVAGNISKAYTQKVYLDMTKPMGKILINNGDEYTATRNVNLTLTFGDNESGVDKVRVIEGDKTYEFPSTPNSPITIPWTLDFGVVKTVSIQVVDKAGNVSDLASDSIIVDKLTINNFTLTNVVNPLKFKGNSFNPMVWDFAPQPMMAGGNISFALNVKKPYEPNVVTDSATYKVEIIGDNGYHKVITDSFKDIVSSSFRATLTLPIDAPKGAKVYVSSIATRRLLVSPFDVQTAYFPGPDTSTKAQIGFIDGNIEQSIKFNETR